MIWPIIVYCFLVPRPHNPTRRKTSPPPDAQERVYAAGGIEKHWFPGRPPHRLGTAHTPADVDQCCQVIVPQGAATTARVSPAANVPVTANPVFRNARRESLDDMV